MAKVTKFNFSLDNRWIPKLDGIISRCTDPNKKQDAVLLIEGKEGTGKTTYAIANAYYISEKTGREFNAHNIFFDIDDLIHAYQNTEEQIFIWDEPAFQMLSTDKSRIVSNLTRLLMMGRKKRHILIINVAHFNKFNDYIICDRPIGMLKTYEDKRKQIRAIYIPGKNLRRLWDDWKTKHKKFYFKYASKRLKVHSFPDVLNPKYKHNVLKHFDNAYYERMKDKAIGKIGGEDKTDIINAMKKKFVSLAEYLKDKHGTNFKDSAELMGVAPSTLLTWKNGRQYDVFAKKMSQKTQITAKFNE